MNLFEVIDFLLRLVFIDLSENAFIIILSLIVMKKKLEYRKVLPVIIITTFISQFLYISNDAFVLDRMILFISIVTTMLIFRNIDFRELIKVVKSIALTMGVMVIIQSIALLPFILFLELDMNIVKENVISLVALSIPTRMMEWMAVYLYYIKRGIKNEEDN